MKHKYIWTIILLFSLAYITGVSYIIAHEAIHYTIFTRYNIESRIEMDYLRVRGNVIPESMEKCNDSCKSQHALNDIVGYNVATFIAFITFMFFVYLINKKLCEDENKIHQLRNWESCG